MKSEPSEAKEEVGEAARTPAAPPAEMPATTVPAQELEAERKKSAELLNRLKYLQADFENYRKQVARDTEAVVKFANEALLARLLPVLDDFDAAMAHLDGEASKGIQMVRENLWMALRAAGVEEIPAKGQQFDPYVHDALQQVSDPKLEDGVVKEVVRKGYRLPDRVLRPAQVIVVNNRGETHG
ncbi:MAG TPA: nucleotide exchange factor GrpE [Thermoplasmata archaeon]|nr:nucleotide exchange factor GrpE [Thermoplasmata archaeon]